MKAKLEVPKNYKEQACIINFDAFETKTENLDDYLIGLKAITTEGKGATWGRTYIEISEVVLWLFGVLSNAPLVVYINYVMNKPYFYCYSGDIFSGDAAWFDYYSEVTSDELIDSADYRKLKEVLMDKSKPFINHFNAHSQKWTIVPIENISKAFIAQLKNKHLL